MRAITLLLTTAGLMLPTAVHAQASADCDKLVDTVMRHHLKRTQPFYRGLAIVLPEYRIPQDDEIWAVRDLVRNFDLGDLHTADVTSLHIQSNAAFAVADLQHAENAEVAFEVSPPRFNADNSYAVVRIDGTVLSGMNAKLTYTMLYGMRRDAATGWTFDSYVSPCCARR